jgi:hypothetical protein
MHALLMLSLLAQLRTPADSGPVCYALRTSVWSGLTPREPVPMRVRLDTVPRADRFRLTSEDGPALNMPNWRRIEADSLEFAWSNGFEWVVLRAHVSGDSLSGQAHHGTDQVGEPPSTAEVRGVRVACRGAAAR